MQEKDHSKNIAEARGAQQVNTSAISTNDADRAVENARRDDNENKRKRMISANKNKTKMVTMRAKKRLLLPKAFAKDQGIDRQLKPGETVKAPMHIAEMYCVPVLGFYSDEGGQHTGINRPRHKHIRAELVS